MSMNPAEVEKALLALDHHDRAGIIHRALQNLDPDEPDFSQIEINAAWREELARRIDDVENGRVGLIPLDESFARARAAVSAIHT